MGLAEEVQSWALLGFKGERAPELKRDYQEQPPACKLAAPVVLAGGCSQLTFGIEMGMRESIP